MGMEGPLAAQLRTTSVLRRMDSTLGGASMFPFALLPFQNGTANADTLRVVRRACDVSPTFTSFYCSRIPWLHTTLPAAAM